ncbi:MAG TPA: hypothetical protein VFH06_01095 [Candidatus Saccharimonadales bacterium]|nr:hypothetical protein [Candidatus Saccharimonadales bacterium]
MWSKRIKTIRFLFLLGSLFLAIALLAAIPSTTFATGFDMGMLDGANSARGIDQATTLFGSTGIFTTISNVMLFLVGAISVIMVVIGGMRYVISGGNTANVGAAKNTILYAIVGLVISILAYAVINFVIGSFVPGGEVSGTNV